MAMSTKSTRTPSAHAQAQPAASTTRPQNGHVEESALGWSPAFRAALTSVKRMKDARRDQ